MTKTHKAAAEKIDRANEAHAAEQRKRADHHNGDGRPEPSVDKYDDDIIGKTTFTHKQAGNEPHFAENVRVTGGGSEHKPKASDDAATPAWVRRLQEWTPPSDLLTRKVIVDFAVDKLVQAGKVGMLVAAGGTSKTTLLLHLGICHATGRKFMDKNVKQGTFVLLSPDDSQADLDGALALVVQAMNLTETEASMVAQKVRVASLQGEDCVRTFTTTSHGDVSTTDLSRTIIKACSGIDDLVGIALDTLRQFSGGSTNDEQIIKITIAAATDVANAHGAYVVFCHHTGKSNFRDGVTDLYCGSGSAAIADNARFILLLQTTSWPDIAQSVNRTGQEDGDPLVLRSTRGSLLVKAPPPIFMFRDGYLFGHIAGAVMTNDQKADERDREILRAVRNGAQTKGAVCSLVRGRKDYMLARIDDLIGRGHLSGSQSGSRQSANLMLTASGARFLDAEN